MRDLLSRIMWKIQMIATTKLVELFLWIAISGAISTMIWSYLQMTHNVDNVFFEVFFMIFIYYAAYKIILD